MDLGLSLYSILIAPISIQHLFPVMAIRNCNSILQHLHVAKRFTCSVCILTLHSCQSHHLMHMFMDEIINNFKFKAV